MIVALVSCITKLVYETLIVYVITYKYTYEHIYIYIYAIYFIVKRCIC